MATTPPRMRSPRIRITSLVLALIASAMTLVALPTPAGAATTAPNYTLGTITYAGGTPVQSCRGWGGDADDAGNFYMACPVMRDLDGNGTGDQAAPALYEMDPAGKVVRIGYLPTEYAFNDTYPIRDVGVSPDGNAAYVSVGPNTDNLGQNPNLNPTTKQPMANGATTGTLLRLTRQADGSWLHDTTFKAGPYLIGGNYWAVRYVDVDARGHVYVTVNALVYELDPATGAIVSSFGGGATTAYPGGPWVEGFDKPEGLAVTADGSSLLLVDQQHQIVQRWNRVGATDWARDTTFLLGVPSQVGDYCQTTDHFQSPYDVATDVAGDIYVMDTTCQRVQRFTKAGVFVQTVWSNPGGDDWNHGFAVNWQGTVLLPIEEDVLVRLDPPAKPAPPATPDVRLPVKVRGVVRLAGRGCSPIFPMRRIANAARYRLVDRCATISGRVTKVTRTRTGWKIQVLLPARTARAIWTHTTAAKRIDVYTDRRSRIRSTVRAGRPVTIVGSIVATRSLATAWVMPVDAVAGR